MTDIRQALEEAWERITVRPPSYAFACRDDSTSDETLRQLGEQVRDWAERKARFRRFLDAEAWTDAAMMLVPEGLFLVQLVDFGDGWLAMIDGVNDAVKNTDPAATPALAIAAACIKAKEADDGR